MFELRLSNVVLTSALGFALSLEQLVCRQAIASSVLDLNIYMRPEGKNGSWIVTNE